MSRKLMDWSSGCHLGRLLVKMFGIETEQTCGKALGHYLIVSPELLGILMDSNHPVMIRPALAVLSGVTRRSPRVSQRAIQQTHYAFGVHGTRRSCTQNPHH